MPRGYSGNKLEFENMPISPRCNYAGPLGKLIPTRSLGTTLAAALAAAFRLRR
jgi:hypothetical protein